MSIDPRGTVQERFLNAGVAQFIVCLYTLDRERASWSAMTDDEIDRRVLWLEEEIARIDPAVFQDNETWWSVILEQMKNGLL